MPLLIPFLVGAGTTGAWWWSTSKEEEPSFSSELFNVLKPVIFIILLILFIAWLRQYTQKKKA